MPLQLNRGSTDLLIDSPPLSRPREFHRSLRGYAPTPLVEIPDLARRLQIGRLLVKDESDRLRLPAFKVLGASWAVWSALEARLGRAPGSWADARAISRDAGAAGLRELVAATDGNHGRSVARVARWIGLAASIFVPRGTAPGRIAAIEEESAAVEIVNGDYDDAVRTAAGRAGPRSWLVQDTAWPGYTWIPLRVVEGYSTLFLEIEEQVDVHGWPGVDLVIVQVGVGSLAAAAVRHFRGAGRRRRPVVLGVEPIDAACAAASFARGVPVRVRGPHHSIMAGLNCGTLSSVAWPLLERGMEGVVTAADDLAERAVRDLAAAGLCSGESGAAGLAGLYEMLLGPESEEHRRRFGIGPGSTVLLLSTEGVTDPETHARLLAG